MLVVDNAGRDDEACVSDLITLEVRHSGLSGIVIWGLHRDTSELCVIRLPVVSQGALPRGPATTRRAGTGRARLRAIWDHLVTGDDFVLADDGVLCLPLDRAADIAEPASRIRDTERRQTARMNLGDSLRDQARFSGCLAVRAGWHDVPPVPPFHRRSS